jgi:DNA-binding response OmpR family regulator
MHILVVDDDLPTRKMLRFILEQHSGHTVDEAESAAEAVTALEERDFDLVIADVLMPGLDGFDLCRRIRATSNVPIMIVSAVGETPSRVKGLQLGADEYLPKPFDPSELVARVEAVLRRSLRTARVSSDGVLRLGGLTLDLTTHRVDVRHDRVGVRSVQLTPTEFKLLLVLARSPNAAVSREDLQRALWGPAHVGPEAGYRTVNAYVAELRDRLEADPKNPRYLQTVRGVGYCLRP